MNRREFLTTTGIVAASASIAGCPDGGGGGGDSPSVIEGGQADVSTSIVRGVPLDQRPFEDSVEPVNPEPGTVLTLGDLVFQQAGPRGVVIAGEATNAGDRSFEAVRLAVKLYNVGEDVTGPEGSQRIVLEHGDLDAGSTWQWSATFEEPPAELDFFGIDAIANYG